MSCNCSKEGGMIANLGRRSTLLAGAFWLGRGGLLLFFFMIYTFSPSTFSFITIHKTTSTHTRIITTLPPTTMLTVSISIASKLKGIVQHYGKLAHWYNIYRGDHQLVALGLNPARRTLQSNPWRSSNSCYLLGLCLHVPVSQCAGTCAWVPALGPGNSAIDIQSPYAKV